MDLQEFMGPCFPQQLKERIVHQREHDGDFEEKLRHRSHYPVKLREL